MSNTRRSTDGGSFRQEKYASSPEFELGLNAVLVAKRCSTLTDPKEIELVWFLQSLSHRHSGLKAFSKEILDAFPERIGTAEMHKIGIIKTHAQYKSSEVQFIRDGLNSPFSRDEFLLKGEASDSEILSQEMDLLMRPEDPEEYREQFSAISASRDKEVRDSRPTSYARSAFLNICRNSFEREVPELLRDMCLNPAISPSVSVSYFNNLFTSICALMDRYAAIRLNGMVITEIGRKVLGTLDYAEQQKALVLIEGNARTGKSFVTKAWCESLPGRRRYVQVPSSNDLTVFFRTIAKALGMSASYTLKAHDLRARISDVLQNGHLTLVFDEAHYFFPQTNFRAALPNRINWMLTELVNAGVAVALVSTPQFTISQKVIEKNTHWASEQLMGRISRYMPLPERLEKNDLAAVARYHLPEGDSKSITALVAYAQASRKYLAGIEHSTKEARHESKLQGRDKVTLNDILNAIETSVMPSDRALQAAVAAPQKGSRKRTYNPPAGPMQCPLETVEPPVQRRDEPLLIPSSRREASEKSVSLL